MIAFFVAAAAGLVWFVLYFWDEELPDKSKKNYKGPPKKFFVVPLFVALSALIAFYIASFLIYGLLDDDYTLTLPEFIRTLTVFDFVRGVFGSYFGFFLAYWVCYLTRVSELPETQRQRHDRLGLLALVLLFTGTVLPEFSGIFLNRHGESNVSKFGLELFGIIGGSFEIGPTSRSSPIVSADLSPGLRRVATSQRSQRSVDISKSRHLTPEDAAKLIEKLPKTIDRHLGYFDDLGWIVFGDGEEKAPDDKEEIEFEKFSRDISGHHELEIQLAGRVFTPLAQCAQFAFEQMRDTEVLADALRPFIAPLRRYSRVYTDPNVVLEATQTGAYEAQFRLLDRLASEGIVDESLRCRLERPHRFRGAAKEETQQEPLFVPTATSVVPSPYKTLALAYFLTMQGDSELAVWELEKWNQSSTVGDPETPGYCPRMVPASDDRNDRIDRKICDWYELVANSNIALLAAKFAPPSKIASIYKNQVDFFEENILKHLEVDRDDVSNETINCKYIKEKENKKGGVIVEILWNAYIQHSNSLSYWAARANEDKSFADARRLSLRNMEGIEPECFLRKRDDSPDNWNEIQNRAKYFKALYEDTYAFMLYRTAQHYALNNRRTIEETRQKFLEARRILRTARDRIDALADVASKNRDNDNAKEPTKFEMDILNLYEDQIERHTAEVEKLIKAIDLGGRVSKVP